jgi:hypothetical protein
MKTFLTTSAVTLPLVFFIYWLFGHNFERGYALGVFSVVAVVIIFVITAIWEEKI